LQIRMNKYSALVLTAGFCALGIMDAEDISDYQQMLVQVSTQAESFSHPDVTWSHEWEGRIPDPNHPYSTAYDHRYDYGIHHYNEHNHYSGGDPKYSAYDSN